MLFCIVCMGNGVNGDGLKRDMLCLRFDSNVCDAGRCKDRVFSVQCRGSEYGPCSTVISVGVVHVIVAGVAV